MDKGGGLQRRSGSQVSHLEMCMLWTSLPRKSSSWGDAARDDTRHLRGLAVCRAPRRVPRTLDLTHAPRHPEAVTALSPFTVEGTEGQRKEATRVHFYSGELALWHDTNDRSVSSGEGTGTGAPGAGGRGRG